MSRSAGGNLSSVRFTEPEVELTVTRPWPASAAQAMEMQQRLADRVIESGAMHKPYIAAGADVHVGAGPAACGIAAVVSVAVPGLEVVEKVAVEHLVHFPYVPGLLSFRELLPLLAALRRLTVRPDVLLIDGHGRAHPRGFGLACHVGVEMDMATVGCAKSRLVGEQAAALDDAPGANVPLLIGSRLAGIVLRTKPRCRPLFVSVGHRISLQFARAVVLDNLDGYRLPRCLRLAHQLAKEQASR